MPGSLPSLRSRSSGQSWRSLPYILRRRQQSPSIGNAPAPPPPPEPENDSDDSTIVWDLLSENNESEHSIVEDDPPLYDTVVSDAPAQTSSRDNPLSDGIPYRPGQTIPEGFSRHAAMVARIRQSNLERLSPNANPIVEDLRSHLQTTQADIRKLRELHLKALRQVQKIEHKIDKVCRRSDRLRQALRDNGDLASLRDYVEGERLLPNDDFARHN